MIFPASSQDYSISFSSGGIFDGKNMQPMETSSNYQKSKNELICDSYGLLFS